MAFTRGKFITLQKKWDNGYRKDIPRDQLPSGSYFAASDMIPNFDGWGIAERASWQNAGVAFSAGAIGVDAGIVGKFIAGDYAVAITADAHLWWDALGASPVDRGAGNTVVQNPVFYRDLVIVPRSSAAILSANSGGNAALTGAPSALYAAPYKSRLLAANDGTNVQRVWVNGLNATTGAPDPNSWSTGNNGDWFDLPEQVTGLAALRTACLIFTNTRTFRLRGSTPGRLGDMAIDPLFTNAGCSSAFSISSYGDYVIWADLNGVYMSDGATLVNLVSDAQIKNDWGDWSAGFVRRISTGVWKDYLFVSVASNSNPPSGLDSYDSFLFDLRRRTAISRLSNFKFPTYFPYQLKTGPVLYAGMLNKRQLVQVETIFDPTSGGLSGFDGDGVVYLPYVETPFYRDDPGRSRVRHLYVNYGLKTRSGDTVPSVTVKAQFEYGQQAAAPTTLATLPITESAADDNPPPEKRKRIPVRRAKQGLAFRFEVVAADGARKFGLDTLEIEQHPTEKFRA